MADEADEKTVILQYVRNEAKIWPYLHLAVPPASGARGVEYELISTDSYQSTLYLYLPGKVGPE